MTDPILWTLVALQLAMGGFDVLYHHEFTERLPWRPSATHELKLHAFRNFTYALLFCVFAWSEPHGLWAIAAAALLLIEVGITLWDFVEEDLTRKLPASERVTHTLLALNYGAILILVLPVLYVWSGETTAFASANYGWASIVLTASALGVAVFGIRDLFMSNRVRTLGFVPADGLLKALPPRSHVLVTGATGFIGTRLVEALAAGGHTTIVATRNRHTAAHLATPHHVIESLDEIPNSTRLHAIINLAGAPVAGAIWTRRSVRNMLRSRLKTIRALKQLLERLPYAPEVFVQASAIGIYGPQGDEKLDEDGPQVDCITHRITHPVEQAAARAVDEDTRLVNLRIGLVLGHTGGMLAQLLPSFDWCVGGRIGSGQQWMSWIERDDLVRMIGHVIANDTLSGPINATAPEPVHNSDFATALGRAMHRPHFLPLPAFPLKLIFGKFADELLLTGQRVVPAKALASGFRFSRPRIETAMAYCVNGPAAAGDYEAVQETGAGKKSDARFVNQ